MDDDHKAVYAALAAAQQHGEAVSLATVVSTQGSMPRHAGSKLLIKADGDIVGTIGGGKMESEVVQAALATLEDGNPRLETYRLNNIAAGDPGICGGSAQIFIEPIRPAPTLLVIGAGHCGAALAQLGKWLGYRVVVSDDRAELCNDDHIPDMDAYAVCKPAAITEHITINKQTYVAAVTRGLPIDIDLIPVLLQSDAAYIGLIGSQRRWTLTREALREKHHISDEDLSRIRAPIGLELEAETPKEIAMSIMAEITMQRRGGTGAPMRQPLKAKEKHST